MPAARVGARDVAGTTSIKGTVGASFFLGDHLKVLPNYELLLVEGADAHAGILTLQGGF